MKQNKNLTKHLKATSYTMDRGNNKHEPRLIFFNFNNF